MTVFFADWVVCGSYENTSDVSRHAFTIHIFEGRNKWLPSNLRRSFSLTCFVALFALASRLFRSTSISYVLHSASVFLRSYIFGRLSFYLANFYIPFVACFRPQLPPNMSFQLFVKIADACLLTSSNAINRLLSLLRRSFISVRAAAYLAVIAGIVAVFSFIGFRSSSVL